MGAAQFGQTSGARNPTFFTRFFRWSVHGAAGLVGLAFLGIIYQTVAENIDMRRFPPPGELVDVGGHRLHIYCIGNGIPTVVLEAGLNGSSLDWSRVSQGAARFARVCAYDRAGNGWSDSGPKPRTSVRVATELHSLLNRGGLHGPYVLVGHSLGARHVQVYTRLYPDEVVGVLLVAPELETEWVPRGFVWNSEVQQLDLGSYSRPLQARLGITRLRGKPSTGFMLDKFPPNIRATATAIGLRSQAYDFLLYEGPALKETREKVRAERFPNIPLVVLLAGEDLEREAYSRFWLEEKSLAKLSPQGKQIILQHTNHYIHLSQPGTVVGAIRAMVESARRKLCGSTSSPC